MRSGINAFHRILLWLIVVVATVEPWTATAQPRVWVVADKAVDGDTFRLRDGSWVRCSGIDAPEIDHKDHTSQPMGSEALQFLGRLVNHRKVALEGSEPARDNYGRQLALVWTQEGQSVNHLLIEHGLAHVLAFAPYTDTDARLLEAQRQAMGLGKGLWQRADLKSIGQFIGNSRSRRFHRADCPQAKKIHPKNRVTLSRMWDGYWMGYAPCRHCFPVK